MTSNFQSILQRIQQRLPYKPDWIVLSTVDGLPVASVGQCDLERMTAITASAEASGRRIATTGSTMMDIMIVIGDHSLIVFQNLSEDYRLGLAFSGKTELSALYLILKSLNQIPALFTVDDRDNIN